MSWFVYWIYIFIHFWKNAKFVILLAREDSMLYASRISSLIFWFYCSPLKLLVWYIKQYPTLENCLINLFNMSLQKIQISLKSDGCNVLITYYFWIDLYDWRSSVAKMEVSSLSFKAFQPFQKTNDHTRPTAKKESC